MHSSLIAVLIIVITIPIIWFLVIPQWGDIGDLRARNGELEESIIEEREANIRLLELAEKIEARQEEVDNLEQTVGAERDVATLIAVYEEAASQNGLVLEGVSPVDPLEGGEGEPLGPTGPLFESFASSITLSGTYPAFRAFLVDVEHSFPLVDIGKVSFTLDQEEGQAGVIGSNPPYAFEVLLTSYYLK